MGGRSELSMCSRICISHSSAYLQLQHTARYGSKCAVTHGWSDWNRWERVEESKMPVVREREAIEHNFSFDQYPQMVVWACALCVDWDGRRDEARTHLKDV